MPKTKEEVLKILEKNYHNVQVKELEVYDKKDSLNKEFVKSVKDLKSQLTKENKEQTQEDKDIQAKYKSQLQELVKKDNEHQKDVERRKQDAEKLYAQSLADNEANEKAEIEKINAQIEEISKDYDALVIQVQEKYNADIETSKKTIVDINEKGVKDQNTFDAKVEDLKAKHEAVIADLNEKEKVKIEKLTEAANQKVAKIEELIVEAKEKYAKSVATEKNIYLEELSEIEEKMAEEKEEYESKHASIRESADKRIAVREKHLHRAMDENDTRSVKQHKKDIDKYRKEADKDLLTLRKDFNAKNTVAVDYRKNFIKENYEKFADMEKAQTKVLEDKNLEIDNIKVVLNNDVENTKLEFEKAKADELEKYNQAYAETRVKQTEVKKQQELDLVTEEFKQIDLKIVFDKDNEVNVNTNKYNQEAKQKALRDIEIEKNKVDALAKDVIENEKLRLENELAVASVELEKNKSENAENEHIEHHGVQHKRHTSAKEEFNSYQQTLEPLFTGRVDEMLAYEELEINNRYDLKVAFIEDERKKIEADFKVVVAKIDEVLEKERVHFDKHIEAISGEEKVALDEYVTTEEEKLAAMKDKLSKLHPRKNKKEIRTLEDQIASFTKQFNAEKANKENQIRNATKVFQEALDAAVARRDKATEEFTAFKDSELSKINNALDMLGNQKDQELNNIKERHNTRIEEIKEFVNQATSRHQLNTEENQTFLDARVQSQQDNIEAANKLLEQQREQLNNEFNQSMNELANAKNEMLDTAKNAFATEESDLESYKNNTDNTISGIESNAKNSQQQENNNHNQKADGIKQEFAGKVNEINNVLADQTKKYNEHLSDISSRTSQESSKFDNEKKRVQKEYDQRVKEETSKINSQLSKDISNIE